jgi:hypothetical protein
MIVPDCLKSIFVYVLNVVASHSSALPERERKIDQPSISNLFLEMITFDVCRIERRFRRRTMDILIDGCFFM